MYRKLYHIHLFCLGFVYYLILPLYVVMTNSFTTYPGMNLLYQYYDKDFVSDYILIISFLGISFILGALLPLRFLKNKLIRKKDFSISHRDIFLTLLPFWIIGQYQISSNYQNLFQGYLVDYNAEFIGSIATLNTIFLFFFLYIKNTIKNDERSKFTYYFIIFSILEFSITLLGLGSRMYIMIPIVSYVIYLLDQNKIKLKSLILKMSIVIIGLLGVGIWRLGNSTYSIDAIAYIGIAEPVFTWISAESMFDFGDLPLFAIPYNFITSFLNFIPSFILPNKTSLIQPINITYYNPLGATSILVSLISNFGIMGSAVAFFLLGFFLTYIRTKQHNNFIKTYYYSLCGIIPFQLFRDNISIINKMLFFNLLIIPAIIFLIEKIIATKYSQKP